MHPSQLPYTTHLGTIHNMDHLPASLRNTCSRNFAATMVQAMVSYGKGNLGILPMLPTVVMGTKTPRPRGHM